MFLGFVLKKNISQIMGIIFGKLAKTSELVVCVIYLILVVNTIMVQDGLIQM